MGFARSGRCLLIVPMALAGSLAHAADEVPAPPVDVLPPAVAAPAATPAGVPTTGSVETGLNHNSLSSSYPDENGAYLRGVLQRGKRNTWSAELVQQSEFGDRGVFYSFRNTHTISPDWFTHLSIGSSSGGFFFPRAVVNAVVNKKWNRRRDLVTSFGLGYNVAKDDHRDLSSSVGAAYYLRSPWIIEGGIRWNDSTPGAVLSQSQFIAITEGRNKKQYVTLRLGFGREAYELIGPATALADFPSREVSLTWRRWIKKDWGINLVGSYYHNPSYDRKGITIGTFKEF
jgi:YaiO family outer membrane protein